LALFASTVIKVCRHGGVYNRHVLVISDSTISGNVAVSGGGIYNDGLLTINNSTLSSNQVWVQSPT